MNNCKPSFVLLLPIFVLLITVNLLLCLIYKLNLIIGMYRKKLSIYRVGYIYGCTRVSGIHWGSWSTSPADKEGLLTVLRYKGLVTILVTR